jgi:hypothetical protein
VYKRQNRSLDVHQFVGAQKKAAILRPRTPKEAIK